MSERNDSRLSGEASPEKRSSSSSHDTAITEIEAMITRIKLSCRTTCLYVVTESTSPNASDKKLVLMNKKTGEDDDATTTPQLESIKDVIDQKDTTDEQMKEGFTDNGQPLGHSTSNGPDETGLGFNHRTPAASSSSAGSSHTSTQSLPRVGSVAKSPGSVALIDNTTHTPASVDTSALAPIGTCPSAPRLRQDSVFAPFMSTTEKNTAKNHLKVNTIAQSIKLPKFSGGSSSWVTPKGTGDDREDAKQFEKKKSHGKRALLKTIKTCLSAKIKGLDQGDDGH